MGRPKRVFQDELPYHVTSRTVHELKGFFPHIQRLNTDFQTAIAAQWRQNNKPTRKKSVEKLAAKVVNMFFTRSERSEKEGSDRRRYDSEAVQVYARAAKRREQEKNKKNQGKKKGTKGKKTGKKGKSTRKPTRPARMFSKSWLKQELKDEQRAEKGEFIFKYFSRQLILAIITLALQQIVAMGFELHHFVLMENHYHMLGKAAKATIDKVMHKFNLFIAKQINQLLGRKGAFFDGRYKANIVGTDELGGVLLRYVYQNPVRAKIAIYPENHDMTTFIVYIKGDKFRVDLSTDCPIIEYLCPDKDKRPQFVKELVRGQLPEDLAARLRFALRRHVVWMTSETYERLSERLKEEIREHYIKLDQALKRYDLYSRI